MGLLQLLFSSKPCGHHQGRLASPRPGSLHSPRAWPQLYPPGAARPREFGQEARTKARHASRDRFNDRALAGLAKDLAPEGWRLRPVPDSSHAGWLLGHLTLVHRVYLPALGVEIEIEAWEERFRRGSRPGEEDAYPPPEALIEDFRSIGARIAERLRGMSDAEASGPYVRTMPDGSSTIEGAGAFDAWHEAYHLGQIGLLRRAAGRPGLA